MLTLNCHLFSRRFVTFTYSKPENISDHVIAKHLKEEGIQQSHI